MISVVMPFYRKDIEFNYVFNNYNLKIFNDFANLELLLIVDDPNHYQNTLNNLTYLTQQKIIHFPVKVFLNDKEHAWRPPCKAINVGICHAQFEKILVISPETICTKRAIEQLAHGCTQDSYSIGLIKFIATSTDVFRSIDEIVMDEQSSVFNPYGSIMFTKEQAYKIGGYDEDFKIWGGDDNDFRLRLKRAGYKQKITLAKFLHINLLRTSINGSIDKKHELKASNVMRKINKIEANTIFIANNGVFGQDFNRVIFDNQKLAAAA